MKKYLALILGVFFVLAFAVSAFAEVTLTGEIKHWNWYRDNMADYIWISGPLTGQTFVLPLENITSQSFSMTRIRLGADIKVSDNVSGMIELETEGPSSHPDFYQWESLNSKQSGLNLRQGWILYTGDGLLGIPAGIKMGHMPLILGLGKFLNNTRYGDDAIVLFADPNKQLHIGLLTFKVNEGSDFPDYSNAQDVDVYAGVMTYKIDDKNNFGINYVRVNDPEAVEGLREFQNFMLHGAADAAGLSIKAEIDYQFGKLDTATPNTKAAGYLLFAELGYKVDPVGIRAAYGNGSGNDTDGDNEYEQFINFLGPDMNVAFIYEYQIMGASFASGSSPQNRSGLANTTMYNIGLDLTPMKDLAFALDGYLFRANKVDAGMSKKVGTEVDLKAKYNVSKGLSWTVVAGYFSPGQYYQDFADNFSVTAEKKKACTSVRSDLTLSF